MFGVLSTPVARRIVERSELLRSDLVREVIGVTEVPAPTFQEAERSRYVARRFADVGVRQIDVDELGNVIARLRGGVQGAGPVTLLVAHLDTVFPSGTDTRVRVDGDLLWAPGVGDNSAGVAVMVQCARVLAAGEFPLSGDVILVGTVGEEGLGNLRGMREIMGRFSAEVEYVVVMDGVLGGMVREGVGSRRHRLGMETEGGHSWGSFGSPSAVHSLAKAVARIADLPVAQNPKTTFNVGTIQGGTFVNVIAAHAEALLDLRSMDAAELVRIEAAVRRIIADVARETGASSRMELLGERPVGAIAEGHVLCAAVRAVHRLLGIHTRSYASSTDANIPLSLGIPAVTIGVTAGANGHRLDEYIQTEPLPRGLAQVLLLLMALQETGSRRQR